MEIALIVFPIVALAFSWTLLSIPARLQPLPLVRLVLQITSNQVIFTPEAVLYFASLWFSSFFAKLLQRKVAVLFLNLCLVLCRH